MKLCQGEDCREHGLLLVHTEDDPSWQGIVLSVAARLSEAGPLYILDLSGRNFPRRTAPAAMFQSVLAHFGVKPIRRTSKVLAEKFSVIPRIKSPNLEYFDAQGAESVSSGLLTFLGTSWLSNFPFLGQTLKSRLKRDYAVSFHSTRSAIDGKKVCTVVIPNGRFPLQSGCITAAKSAGKKLHYYEKSWKPSHYILSDLRTHDFRALQAELRTVQGRLSKPDLDFSKSWFSSRINDNRHLAEIGANFSGRQVSPHNSDYLVIFTSSSDEFDALGELWPKPSWADQYEAFSYFLSKTRSDQHVVMRVHPNSINKPLSQTIKEIISIRSISKIFPNIQIISPLSHCNSYHLAQYSRGVYVWESTIGLESSYLGRRVYNFAPALWDEMTGSTPLFGPDDFSVVRKPTNAQVARAGALNFVAGLTFNDYPVTSIGDWEARQTPAHYLRNVLCLTGFLSWWLLIHRAISSRLSRALFRLFL